MEHYRTAPIPLVLRFIDCINRGDIDGLAELMPEDYALKVFDEPSQLGREHDIDGWRGYAAAYPRYLIYPERIAQQGQTVAVLGTTTGSHLGLPDDEERKLTLIWLGDVHDGHIRRWTLIEDTPEHRARFELA